MRREKNRANRIRRWAVALLTATILSAALSCCTPFDAEKERAPVPAGPGETAPPAAVTAASGTARVPGKEPIEAKQAEIDVGGLFGEHARRASEILSDMTPEQKAAQLFFVRCPEKDKIDETLSKNPAGILLFQRDFADKTRDEVIESIKAYQSKSRVKLIIGVDEEGGTVVRASSNPALAPARYPSPQSLFKKGGMEEVARDAIEKSRFLLSLGVNMNLAPVADVSVDPRDFIFRRAFGKSAAETAEYVKTVVSAMRTAGIAPAVKHFPGYGNNADTHNKTAVDERSLDSFRQNDFIPFRAAIAEGAACVLISHNIVLCMDDEMPASLSQKAHKVLTQELGFSGIVMTDDLSMGAVAEYLRGDDPAVLAVKAGNDLLITGDFENGLACLLAAVKCGEVGEETIDKAAARVLAFKLYMGMIV